MDYTILNKKRHWFYFSTLLIGVIFFVWEIKIYRKTIIDKNLLILLIVVTGTAAFILDYKKYSETYELPKTGTYIFAWLQNILSWGFLFCSLFMISNFYLSEEITSVEKYEIIEKSSMPGTANKTKRQLLIRINYEGVCKELVFRHSYFAQMENYKSVTLETTKGLFGFDVIKNQLLNE